MTKPFDVGGLGYNSNTNKGQEMTSNINRSGEVIQNLKTALDGNSNYAYSYAFGYAWAMLTEKERTKLLELAERKANEAKENN